MNSEDIRRVEAWLYNVPRIKIAIESLSMELRGLDARAASKPMVSSNPTGIHVTGGSLNSLQDRWLEFLDDYEVQRTRLQERIRIYQEELDRFNRVIEMLGSENPQLVQLVNKKYFEKIKPDQIIWDTVLFVGKTKFYEMRRYVLSVFFECLPGCFKERTNCEPKTA